MGYFTRCFLEPSSECQLAFWLINSIMDPSGIPGSCVPPMTSLPVLVVSMSVSVVSSAAPVVTSTQAATSALATVSQSTLSTSATSATVRLCLTPKNLSSIATAVAGILGQPLSTTTSAPPCMAQAPPSTSGGSSVIMCVVVLPCL